MTIQRLKTGQKITGRIDLSRMRTEQTETDISLGLRCFLMVNIASLTGGMHFSVKLTLINKQCLKLLERTWTRHNRIK